MLSSNSLWNIVNFRGSLVQALVADGWKVQVAVPSTPDERAVFELSATIVPLTIERSGTSPMADLGLLRQYRMVMRAERPDAYLGWTVKPNIYGAFAARMAGVPAILNVSGLGTAFLSGRLFGAFIRRLYKLAFKSAYIVFFQNMDDKRLFVESGIVRLDQARLLPGSGVNLTDFAMTPLPSDGATSFLLVARLLGDKGIREFVEAAQMTRHDLPGAKFKLLGPIDHGNRTAISESELEQWINEGVVEYLGEASDVRPHIADATIVVLPSYREGLPRTLLEAAAMGRPLIATDVPGCREVVDHKRNGLLCEARNASSLRDAMLELGKMDIKRLRAMGALSREMVEARFSEELVAAAYVDALAGLSTGKALRAQ